MLEIHYGNRRGAILVRKAYQKGFLEDSGILFPVGQYFHVYILPYKKGGGRGKTRGRSSPEWTGKGDPFVSRPSGRWDHVQRRASPSDRRISGGKGTQGETAQGKEA